MIYSVRLGTCGRSGSKMKLVLLSVCLFSYLYHASGHKVDDLYQSLNISCSGKEELMKTCEIAGPKTVSLTIDV